MPLMLLASYNFIKFYLLKVQFTFASLFWNWWLRLVQSGLGGWEVILGLGLDPAENKTGFQRMMSFNLIYFLFHKNFY